MNIPQKFGDIRLPAKELWTQVNYQEDIMQIQLGGKRKFQETGSGAVLFKRRVVETNEGLRLTLT